MNRIQKKCFIASAAFHLLLALILLIGPAFLSSDSKRDLQTVDFVPSKLVDALMMGGGNPNGRLPEPTPPAPAPPQLATPAPAPAPPLVKVTRPEPPSIAKSSPDVVELNKAHKPQINTQLVKRPRNAPANPKQAPNTDVRRIESEIGKVAANIRNNSSSSTDIEPIGPGGGGEAYANYDAWVRTVYMQAWIEPEGVSGNITTPKASITIARDGTVTSARIIQYSGNATVDRAVQAELDRVKFIAPFPEGSREEKRTYTINFNLDAKKLL